jgi:hypothetical protein
MKTVMRKSGNFFRNHQRLLAVSLAMASVVACKKSVVEPSVETDSELNASVSTKAIGNLIWSDNLEGSSYFTSVPSVQTSTSYAITTASNPVYQGYKSARFELRDTDPENHSGTRTEISFDDATNLNRWYSYALYAPSAYYKYDADDEIITQWHQGGGLTPALCLRVKSDKLYIRILGSTWVELGAFDKDAWHAYVMHIKHSSGSDGLIEIWKDGVKILNRSGANMYKVEGDLHNPNVKMGIYKSDWNGSGTTATNIRVLYLDDIKIGNENATYADMVPTKNGTTTPTTPTDGSSDGSTTLPVTDPTTSTSTLSVTDFKLVNSETEKDVVSITNGATISLSALRVSKANIRAVVGSTTSSVKFELSGTQSKSYTDSDAPYALHGDSGSGNFYYGNWNPPALGTYTLKATPYSANKASGTAGAAKTITFTIVK